MNSKQLKIQYVKLKEIKPYKNNAKKHGKEQVEIIKNSIKEFGFRLPIILDSNNVVVAGHGRCIAAKQLGIKEIPCVYADDLTEEQIKALRLVDNKSSEGEYDKKILKDELDSIFGDIDMSAFGFGVLIEDIDVLQEGEREIAPELGEANNYIVLEFDTDLEWDDAQYYFKLKEVETPDKNKKIRRKGIGRVIKGKDIIEKLKKLEEIMGEDQ